MSLLRAFQQHAAAQSSRGPAVDSRSCRAVGSPIERAQQAPGQDAPVDHHLDQRRRLWQLAQARGFPAVQVLDYAQPVGAAAWTTFCRTVPVRWLEAAEQALVPVNGQDVGDLESEALARTYEILSVAKRLRGWRSMSLDDAEALLVTYKDKIAAWRIWMAEHEADAPEVVAEAHSTLCRLVRALPRIVVEGRYTPP